MSNTDSVNDESKDMRNYMKKYGINLHILLDAHRQIS